MKALILNADYTIINIAPIEKALALVHIKNVATELDFYKNRQLRSGRKTYTIPAVILLKKYVKHDFNRKKKFSRSTVLKRDKYTCQYCGLRKTASELTIDHLHPKCKFKSGDNPTYYENVVTACGPCNRRKADKTCAESNMYPLVKPVHPSYYEIILSDVGQIPIEWEPYLPKRLRHEKKKSSFTN